LDIPHKSLEKLRIDLFSQLLFIVLGAKEKGSSFY